MEKFIDLVLATIQSHYRLYNDRHEIATLNNLTTGYSAEYIIDIQLVQRGNNMIEGFDAENVSLVLFNKQTRYREVYDKNINMLKRLHSSTTEAIIGDHIYNPENGEGCFIEVQHGVFVNIHHILKYIVFFKKFGKAHIVVGSLYNSKRLKVARRRIPKVRALINKMNITIERWNGV